MSVQWIGLLLMAATINEVVLQENETPGTAKYTTTYIPGSKIVELRKHIGVPEFPRPHEKVQYTRIAVVGESNDDHGKRITFLKKGTLIHRKLIEFYTGPAYYVKLLDIDESFVDKYIEYIDNPYPMSIQWDKPTNGDDRGIQMKSENGNNNFGLSDLFYWNWNLMAISRNTNTIYYFDPIKGDLEEWITINDETGKIYQFEWATPKMGLRNSEEVYVGSIGISGLQDVFVVQKNGSYIKRDWTKNYKDLKHAASINDSGYMLHHSCSWSYVRRMFFMMPSSSSNEAYDLSNPNRQSTNLLLSIDEYSNFAEVTKRIGEIDEKKHYVAFKFLPSHSEEIIIALKNSEDESGFFQTYIEIFKITGEILYKSTLIETTNKNVRYSELEVLYFDPIVAQ